MALSLCTYLHAEAPLFSSFQFKLIIILLFFLASDVVPHSFHSYLTLTLLTLREKLMLIVLGFFFQKGEMKYPFLLYIMQYLKFQLIKKQTPSTPPKAVFYPPPGCSQAPLATGSGWSVFPKSKLKHSEIFIYLFMHFIFRKKDIKPQWLKEAASLDLDGESCLALLCLLHCMYVFVALNIFLNSISFERKQ